jgi:hypothetical protein
MPVILTTEEECDAWMRRCGLSRAAPTKIKRARHDQSSFHGILLFWTYRMEQKF